MLYVRTFAGLIPPFRGDGEVWTAALLEESAALHGPFTLIETVALEAPEDPADPDPVTVTTDQATLETGYYRVVWEDGDGATEAGPIFYVDPDSTPSWAPSVDQVARLVWARTKAAGGKRLGTFTDATSPTRVEAESIIEQATRITGGWLVAEPCTGNLREASRANAALYATMLIEASFWPEQTEASGSSFQARLKLWEKGMERLATLIKANCGGGGEEGEESVEGGALPQGAFDDGELIYGREWPPAGDW